MAGDVKVAVVSGPISSGATGSADFTKAGFGTPKACVVLLSHDPVDDVNVAAQSRASIGFSDFTNHRCITHQDEDGSAKVDSDSRKSATRAYVILSVAASVIVDGTASAITDGVRLTNTSNAPGLVSFATVIMFGGADLQVSVDSISLPNGIDLNTVVTTGIPQDLVFFIGTDISAEDNTSTGINNSFGVVDISDDQATIVNRSMGWSSDHNNAVGTPACILRNDRCLVMLTESGDPDWQLELTAATPTSYTVTTRNIGPGAGMEIYALALNLDDRGSKVGSVDSPTAGATWTPAVALGFTPQYVGLGLTHTTVENIAKKDELGGSVGLSSNTGTGEETFHGWYNEDAAPTTNTNNNFRSRVLDLRNHDVTVIVHDHSHLLFNNGDWTYTINVENETIAKKWFYWAIEVPALVADENINVKMPRFYRGVPPPVPVAISNLAGLQFTGAVPPPRVQAVLPRIEPAAFRPRPEADFDVVGLFPTGIPPVLDEQIHTRFPQIVSGVRPPLPVSLYSETGRFRAAPLDAHVIAVFPQIVMGEAPPFPAATHSETGRFRAIVAPARVIAVFPQIVTGGPPPLPRSVFDLTGLLHIAPVGPPSERIETRFPQIVAGVPPPLPVSGYSETGRFRAVLAEARVIAVFPQIAIGTGPPLPTAAFDLTGLLHITALPPPDERIHTRFPQIVTGWPVPLPLASFTLTGLMPTGLVFAPAALYEVFAPQIVTGTPPPFPEGDYFIVGFIPRGVIVLAIEGGFFKQDFFN